jgi:hypothetical protein
VTNAGVAPATEAILTAAGGAALGALAGGLVGRELAVPLAVVAGANGLISGWRGIYRWRARSGPVAFVLDSTWGGVTTLGGLAAHAIGVVRGRPGYHPELSRRHNRHVYARGFQLRPRFALTVGNVVSGAGDVSNPRRAKLVTDHEDVHAWQARWFGPLYPFLYGVWWAGGAAIGLLAWVVRKRSVRLGKVLEGYGYYCNPFEWWAYSRDDHWPPSGKPEGLGWRRPAVRAFSATRPPR